MSASRSGRRGRKKYSSSHHHTLNELNITPLLVLAFVLLVIFIITTAPTANDIELDLPSAAARPKDEPKPNINNVSVAKNGGVFFNAEPITLKDLRDRLIAYAKSDPDIHVMVRGDQGVDYQNVVNVLDVLTEAGVTKIGLATDTASR
jgi:biopolymer transport protein ExbD